VISNLEIEKAMRFSETTSSNRETLAVEQFRNTLGLDGESLVRHSTTEVN